MFGMRFSVEVLLLWLFVFGLVGLSSALHLARGPVSAPRIAYKRISPVKFNSQVKLFRGLGVVAGSLVAFNYKSCNALIAAFYNRLKESVFFQHFSFEPLFASTCFAIYIALFAAIDYWIPSLWKYRIQPQGNAVDGSSRGDSMIAWKDRLRDALGFEVPLYLCLWIPFGGIVRARKIQQSTSLGLVVGEVLAALLLYDLFFYVGHRLLHRVPWMYEEIHKKHHAMSTVRAGDAVRHSMIDGIFDVCCAVFSLMILRANALSRTVFNAVAIFLIVEAHSGMLLPFSPSAVLPSFFSGPVAHDAHHLRGFGNYAKFFTHLDALFSTQTK